MSKDLRLQIILDAINRVTEPAKIAMKSISDLGKNVKEAKDRLKEMEQANARMQSFRDTARAISVKTNAIKGLSPRLKALKEEIAATSTPSKALVREFERVRNETQQLKAAKTKLLEKAQHLRTELQAAGTPTRELAKYQVELKVKTDQAREALEKEKAALKATGERMQKLAAAKATYDQSMATRNRLAGTGAGMVAGGAAMGAPIVKAVRDYTAFEDAMLGVARQVEGAKDEAGNFTKVYDEMGEAIKGMSERIPMSATDLANIVTEAAKMGIQGKDDLLKFAEVAAMAATSFDLPVDQLSQDLSVVAKLYNVPIANINQLGDAINWLDDQAQSNGGDIIEVMKRIAGPASTVNMQFQEAAALGSTFLSLGARAEVAASATNAMIGQLANATMQSKTFQKGMAMLKLNSKDIQLRMNTDATGTILKVMEAIKALPQEKQLEAATRLFGKEFGDDASKLANRLDEYRKQLADIRAEEAKGSMQREADTKNQTMTAQYEMMQNSIFNLSSEIGGNLKPSLVDLMQATAGVMKSVRDWTKENPRLTKTLVIALAITAALVVGLGGMALAAAAVIGPLAMLKLSMAYLVAGGGGGALSFFMTLGKTALPMVGNAILFIGRAMMANPIGLAITGIALAAYLIYKYWEPIKAFFSGIWNQVQNAFSQGIGGVTALLMNWSPLGLMYSLISSALGALGIQLPAQFSDLGSAMMQGMLDGITAGGEWVKEKIGNIAGGLKDKVKSVLGIHSPSRVFAELGGFTMAGLAQGLDEGQDGPLGMLASITKKMAAASALAFGLSTPALAMDNRPPLAAGPAQGAAGGASVSIQVIVNPAPGMDEKKLADLVVQKIEEAQRAKAATRRSSLTDLD